MTVDLNIDIGEGGECDAELLGLASSANIACGGHAGGGAVMRHALEQATRAGVAIGAHPGYRDRENFGRVETSESAVNIASEIRRQLVDFCGIFGKAPHHIKPHGALYHRANNDLEVARAICKIILELTPDAWVYAFVDSGLAAVAADAGLKVCGEGFIDRGYGENGLLIPRGQPGAVIESPALAAKQAVHLAQQGKARTLCVHGDGPHAVGILQAARNALNEAGWKIGPPN